MSYEVNITTINQLINRGTLGNATQVAQQLVGLWPLTQAMHMDNDAKYAENLQVRITRVMAQALTGETVTMPDAEFVYEGADEIPGRPQSIVDCLLACNDAYDMLADVSDTGDVSLISDAASALGEWWTLDENALDAMGEVVSKVRDYTLSQSGAEGESALSVEQRVGLLVCAFVELAAIAGRGSSTVAAATDSTQAHTAALVFVVVLTNELADCLAVPRITIRKEHMEPLAQAVIAQCEGERTDDTSCIESVLRIVEQDFIDEWQRHYDDVLWDPEEAKKRAKEEDERKNKEALAAKFAHIKDDPTKEEVEL